MRRALTFPFLSYILLVLPASTVLAQTTESAAEDFDAQSANDDPVQLRPPVIEPIVMPAPVATDVAVSTSATAAETEPASEEATSSDAATPDAWTAPASSFTLHGYFRVRGEFLNNFFLGRSRLVGGGADLPFERFRPIDRGIVPAGGCSGSPEADITLAAPCGNGSKLRYANMRLRLEPTLALSDDVRLHMQLDVFDNLVLGSTPNTELWSVGSAGYGRDPAAAGSTLDSFSLGQHSPQLSDSISVRRAWAEVTNQGLGQLRFGRMGSHWGLGMFQNGGDGIDQDHQNDVDRIMAITRLAGFYFAAAWDFAGEGFIRYEPGNPDHVPYDATQSDDVDQFVFSAARQMDADEQEETLADGGWALNAGLYFMFRKQHLSASANTDPFATAADAGALLARRDARVFTPDLWAQFLWGNLRLEAEAALSAGTITNAQANAGDFRNDDYKILQFGLAFEGEYRLLENKLGIYLYTGFGTGDPDVEGLSRQNDLVNQDASPRGDRTISTYAFNPAYRVDLILFRQILGSVAGAFYLRPGVSYDLIHGDEGQRLGGRFDFIYSRASSPVQSYGSDPNLGVELDVSLYYRSDDGPDLLDGFYGQLQYGILFPLAGLGYPSFGGTTPSTADGSTSLGNAQTFRLLLGVQF